MINSNTLPETNFSVEFQNYEELKRFTNYLDERGFVNSSLLMEGERFISVYPESKLFYTSSEDVFAEERIYVDEICEYSFTRNSVEVHGKRYYLADIKKLTPIK